MTNSKKKSWLLIYNCQAQGLAHCLNLLNSDLHVEYYDPAKWNKHRAAEMQRLDRYQHIVIAPSLAAQEGFDDVHQSPAVCKLPSLDFTGYHPDFCYLESAGRQIIGPMGSCHSILALAAYQCGLTPSQAMCFYNSRVYAKLGYLDHWAAARDELIARYDCFGYDARKLFIEWSRKGPFMHMIVHPKISALNGIAKLLLNHNGEDADDCGLLPHDNLAMGPVFPVYPEIASQIGLQGSSSFKLGGKYRTIGLPEFLEKSFQIYASCADITPWPRFRRFHERASALLADAGS